MAEESLSGIAKEIIDKLGSIDLEEIGLCWGINQEIKKLKDTVSTIKAVLLDAEKPAHESEVKLWLGRLKEPMYGARSLLDDLSTEALGRQVMDGNKMMKKVRLFFSSSNQLVYGLKMGHKIKAIREKLSAINADGEFHLVESRPDHYEVSTRPRSDKVTHFVDPEVVGRKDDKKVIIRRLLDFDNSSGVVAIVGVGGLGKTTLAQLVFKDDVIQSHFELKFWINNEYNFDTKIIERKILESMSIEKPTNAALLAKLKKIINEKRFLLVLDDVGDDNRETWNDLSKLLGDGGSGSRVLVTTRQANVASIAGPQVSPYFLTSLSEEDSWSLLAKMAFGDGEESWKSSIEKMGREIVKKCAGVPLAIKTIGRVLYFKKKEEEWRSFMNKLPERVGHDDGGDIMPILQLSYDHLPSHLKPCFAHCSLFPKGYRIDVETLIQLWIAQGFVTRSSNGEEHLEDIGLECFKNFLWRCFFQEVEYDEWSNMVSCKMHDLMHDLATLVGKGEGNLFLEDGGVDIGGNINILHVSFGFNLESSEQIPMELRTNAKSLRTFLLPCQYWGARSKDWEAILHDFRDLRALDLHELALEKLPASWGMQLMHLTYLDLSGNEDMTELPTSITKLQNLQVLKLCYCKSLTELPKAIRRLKNLRYLNCWGCDNLRRMPYGLGFLQYLWRLPLFVVGEDSGSGRLGELGNLNNLRGSLEIRNLRNAKWKDEDPNLKGKNLLQSLHLDWGRNAGYNWAGVDTDHEEMCFQRLELHRNLKVLKVGGYGGVSWTCSLTNLVKLTIYNWGRCQRLCWSWQEFPCLQELVISGLSELVIIDNWGTSFPSLKSLSLWYCPKLLGWRKSCDVSLFDRLSTLMIRECPKLTHMPPFPSLTDQLLLEGSGIRLLRKTMNMLHHHHPPPLSNLKELRFGSIRGLKSLPEEWLQNLNSLQQLHICKCPDLESLPPLRESEPHYFPSLQRLSISRCPRLEKKCGNKWGKDWSKISHIPKIEIADQVIQIDGRYLLDDEIALGLQRSRQLDLKDSIPFYSIPARARYEVIGE